MVFVVGCQFYPRSVLMYKFLCQLLGSIKLSYESHSYLNQEEIIRE